MTGVIDYFFVIQSHNKFSMHPMSA